MAKKQYKIDERRKKQLRNEVEDLDMKIWGQEWDIKMLEEDLANDGPMRRSRLNLRRKQLELEDMKENKKANERTLRQGYEEGVEASEEELKEGLDELNKK